MVRTESGLEHSCAQRSTDLKDAHCWGEHKEAVRADGKALVQIECAGNGHKTEELSVARLFQRVNFRRDRGQGDGLELVALKYETKQSIDPDGKQLTLTKGRHV